MIGASKTIQAGAVSASALALTQGVLTTMKLAQLKLIGTAILATSVSAGGVIAVSYAAGQGPRGTLDADAVAVNAAGLQERTIQAPSTGVVTSQPAVEDRLEALERKLDQLLTRSSPTSAGTSRENRQSDSGPRDPCQAGSRIE